MDKKIQGLIKRIQTSEDLLSLKNILIDIKKELGFTHITYAIQLPQTLTKIDTFCLSDLPREWINKYSKKEYIKIDPIIKYCSMFNQPYCWDQLAHCKEKRVIEMIKDMKAYDLNGGISLGGKNKQNGTNIFSLISNKPIKTGSSECFKPVFYLTVLHPYLDSAIIKLSTDKEIKHSIPKLTKQELVCLKWIALGKTSNEIAEILSISNTTVIFHLKNVIHKLNAKNRNQAIAQAMLLGIITPQHLSSSIHITYHF